jgi:hypothetical protein
MSRVEWSIDHSDGYNPQVVPRVYQARLILRDEMLVESKCRTGKLRRGLSKRLPPYKLPYQS